ncbi:MAG: hypothetical protein ACLR23_28265 [Clostridia bacterium]
MQEVTYESAYTDVRGLGTILLEQNLKGEAIALIWKNSYGWAISYLAAACVGTVVPLDKEDEHSNHCLFNPMRLIAGRSSRIKNSWMDFMKRDYYRPISYSSVWTRSGRWREAYSAY